MAPRSVLSSLARLCFVAASTTWWLSLSLCSARTVHSEDAEACQQWGCQAAAARDSILLQSKMNVHSGDVSTNDELVHEIQGSEFRRGEEELDDWTMELTLDHEWIAGGDASDKAYQDLPSEEKIRVTEAMHNRSDEICAEHEEAMTQRKIWTEHFETIHKDAVRHMKSLRDNALLKPGPCRRQEGAGMIAGLYTFGAPATALRPLRDPVRSDGKFMGVRTITQKFEKVRGVDRAFHDPVTFFAGIVNLKHPHMDLLVLPVNMTPQLHDASHKVSRYPRSDMAFWVDGHDQATYVDGLTPFKQQFDPMVHEMLFLSRAVNPNINKHSRERCAQEAGKVGWNLVAQSTAELRHHLDFVFIDNTSLFQHPETLACTLAFVPTHHATQWLANLRFAPSTFCGIPGVHKGFRNQLRRQMRSKEWDTQIRPALRSCKDLYIAGHSLGGGQAQLAAACLQRAPGQGEQGWKDYRYLSWTPGENRPKRLPALK